MYVRASSIERHPKTCELFGAFHETIPLVTSRQFLRTSQKDLHLVGVVEIGMQCHLTEELIQLDLSFLDERIFPSLRFKKVLRWQWWDNVTTMILS